MSSWQEPREIFNRCSQKWLIRPMHIRIFKKMRWTQHLETRSSWLRISHKQSSSKMKSRDWSRIFKHSTKILEGTRRSSRVSEHGQWSLSRPSKIRSLSSWARCKTRRMKTRQQGFRGRLWHHHRHPKLNITWHSDRNMHRATQKSSLNLPSLTTLSAWRA